MQGSPLLSAITKTGMHVAAVVDALVSDSPTNGNRGVDFSSMAFETAAKLLPGSLICLSAKAPFRYAVIRPQDTVVADGMMGK